MKKSKPVGIFSATLIFLFVYTAISKLLSPDRFEDVLWRAPLRKGSRRGSKGSAAGRADHCAAPIFWGRRVWMFRRLGV